MINGNLTVRSYANALIVPRQKRRYRRQEIGMFADGKYVPWSNSDVVVVPSSLPEVREPDVQAKFVDKDVIFIGTLWCAWGHLITDFARHLWPLLSLDPSLPVVYAVGSPKQKMPENFLQLLEALGVPSSRLVKICEPVRFRNVYFGEPSLWHDTQGRRVVWTAEYEAVIDAVIRGIVGKETPERPTRRVYLTRTALVKGRKDFGERSIEQAYRKLGFGIVSPEKLSFTELVRILADTEVLAATEGSVSHNALFLPRGSKIEVLRKCDYANEYQEAINQIRELKASVYNVSISDMAVLSKEPWRGPFLIGVTPELADHLGVEVSCDAIERLRCWLCRMRMWIRAHRI